MSKSIYDAIKNNKEKQDKVVQFIKSLKDEWDKGSYTTFPSWMFAIFDYVQKNNEFVFKDPQESKFLTSSNTECKESFIPNCYLRVQRQVKTSIFRLDGHMIVEITDPKVEEAIRRNSGVCRCLEGGFCRVIGLYNMPPVSGYKTFWTKIKKEDRPQYIDLRQIT